MAYAMANQSKWTAERGEKQRRALRTRLDQEAHKKSSLSILTLYLVARTDRSRAPVTGDVGGTNRSVEGSVKSEMGRHMDTRALPINRGGEGWRCALEFELD